VKKSTANISTLVAVGGSLVALPAAALELGEAQINSTLGQPLRASIAYALAPNETLANTCVSTQVGQPGGGGPISGASKISVANGIISITGTAVVREPIISMRVNIRCPYAAQLSREYTMFVDPSGIPAQVTSAQAAVATQRVATPQVVAAAPARRRAVSTEPVAPGTRYQVQRYENLGDIAQRIVDRPVALWPAVDAIFAANPDAFLDNDPNKLKAGSWLTIPNFGAAAPLTVASADLAQSQAVSQAVPQAVPQAVEQGSVYTGTTPDQFATPFAPVEELEVYSTPAPATLVAAARAPAFIDIPDTQLEPPVTTSTSPNVATARVQTRPVRESSTNWLLWLAGAGVGLIALMLFFGRQVRNRFGSSPIGAIEPQNRRQTDAGGRMLEEVSEIEVTVATIDELDELDELEETQENLTLDADLIIGSGLQEGSEIDVAQDFGFAATTELDLELPEVNFGGQDADAGTDIIPPLNIEVQSILESEIMADEAEVAAAEVDTVNVAAIEDDDYDMSVIVDATKMPQTEDVTMLDLEAIAVEGGDENLATGDYTVSSEVDYVVLEQDYEDEFSATQALNEEIARAAEEIAESIGKLNDTSMASVAALDITAQIPADNDDFNSDVDETNINTAISDDLDDDEVTARIRAKPSR
jgi:hypothetical protein